MAVANGFGPPLPRVLPRAGPNPTRIPLRGLLPTRTQSWSYRMDDLYPFGTRRTNAELTDS